MRVPATKVVTPLSGLMTQSSPLTSQANPDGTLTTWVTDGNISFPRHPCTHHDLLKCCVAPERVAPHPVPSGAVATAYTLQFRADCEAIDSLSPDGGEFGTQIVALADADAPAALARAFQFGMKTPYGVQPGLSTLPPVTPASCGVRAYTCNGEDPTGAGDGLPLAQAWLVAAEFWRVHGHAGTPLVLAADGLAGFFSMTGLTGPGAGAIVQAGGNMRIVYVPGLAPHVGPSDGTAPIQAGPGFAWIWILGGYYAAVESVGKLRVSEKTEENRKVVTVDRQGIHGFGSCCIAAIKVAVCA